MHTVTPQNKATGQSKTGFAFILITSLFFLWGFAHNLDPILIPHLKKSFTLTTTQSTLIDSAVFIAYFLMALPAGYIMKRFGYKMGIITGLLFFSTGAFLFIPAANTQSYTFFLFALFVIACGLTILETAANPYASALGPHETSACVQFALNVPGVTSVALSTTDVKRVKENVEMVSVEIPTAFWETLKAKGLISAGYLSKAESVS
ncbi:MAG: MFS transporter [Flavisolibacter sp.]|nr:MFS transporter [Flavisolibacter sp.]